MDTTGFELGAKRAKAVAGSIGGQVAGALKSKLIGLVGVAAIEELTRRTIEYGGHIKDVSERLDVATDSLQQFDFAARQNSSSLDSFTGFLEKMNVARSEALSGNEKLIESFKAIGVSLDDLKTKRVDALAKIIGRNISGGDSQKLLPALRDIGGRNAGEAIPTLKGLDEAAAKAKELGLILGGDVLDKLKRLDDAATAFGTRMKVIAGNALSFGLDFFGFSDPGAASDQAKKLSEKLLNKKKAEDFTGAPAKPDQTETVTISPQLSARQSIGAFAGVGPQVVEVKKQTKLLEKIEHNTRPSDSEGMLPA
jgi:hypothetical protein